MRFRTSLIAILLVAMLLPVTVESHEDAHMEIGVELVAEGFTAPVDLEPAPDGSGQLYIVDQIGVISVIGPDGPMMNGPFLDIQDRLDALESEFDERGLLGLTFHPDYVNNGRFYVYYSAPLREGASADWSHTNRLSEFTASGGVADPASERILLEIDKPQFNHNGGDITFGPDGFLYLPLGDGGGADDVDVGHTEDIGNAQDLSNMLGSILRIDVDGGDPYGIPADNPFVGDDTVPDEIWAWGFRNPWRATWDTATGRYFVADAGQNVWEEVSIVSGGQNYGWNVYEGTHCFSTENPDYNPLSCEQQDANGNAFQMPIMEYSHAVGLVVVGGYVYNGSALGGDFTRHYIFGDWSTSFMNPDGTLLIASAPPEGADESMWKVNELRVTNNANGRLNAYINAFGEDSNGELYVLTSQSAGPTGSSGQVWRLVPPTVGPEEGAEDEGATEDTEGDTAGGAAIDVSLVEFSINMPTQIQSGSVTFNVTNNGTMEHNFKVEGNSIESVFDTNLQPAETRSMTIDLPPGTYEVYCPVEDHADQGMRLQLEVTGGEGDMSEATEEASDDTSGGGDMGGVVNVDVVLTEFSITMTTQIQAGTVNFNVTNNGSEEHNFEVEGNDIESVFDTNLQPGETRTMTVDLSPGMYEVYCPVEDHADQGMRLQLEVIGGES
ncbi:MAG: PQQ-dependent sugar dehydrogenase [Chloroflexi bacterium]|nr:PQQ-dependent sugar dehydrogenase [Chloroflexota bacterium]